MTLPEASGALGDSHWDRQFAMPGTETWNYALRFDGDVLYTGGIGLDYGAVATTSVVNVFDGVVAGMATDGSNLFVGGVFTHAGGPARLSYAPASLR